MTGPENLLKQWLECVNGGNIEGLLGLYDSEAVLIPTFSNRILNTPDKLREYFEGLASREGLSVTLHEKTVIVQDMTREIFALSGIYNWRFNIEGEGFNFEARFSYLIDLSKTSPILNHHSSQIPHML